MAIALEMIIVPILLVTVIALGLVAADASLGAVFAGAVGLSLLYFVVINLLRSARREEDRAGEDQSEPGGGRESS